jgi:ubiquitin-conjugating enzyme E2 T
MQKLITQGPPAGVSCWSADDSLMDLEAVIVGPPDSPFEKGFFKLKIHLPERYPFEPPQGELLTRVALK